MIAPVNDATVESLSPLLVSASTARELLGDISDRTLYKLTLPNGPIACIRLGGPGSPRLYPIGELDRFVACQIELARAKQEPP